VSLTITDHPNEFNISILQQHKILFIATLGVPIIYFASQILVNGWFEKVVSILCLYISVGTFIFLPIVGGYEIRVGDAMTHAGTTFSIVQSGYFPNIPSQEIYPIYHIMISIWSIVTGLPVNVGLVLSLAVSFLLFALISSIISNYFRSKQKESQYYGIILAPIFPILVINQSILNPAPSSFGYLVFLPLFSLTILLATDIRGYTQWSVLYITGFIVVWLSHPFVALFCLFMMAFHTGLTRLNDAPNSTRLNLVGLFFLIGAVIHGIIFNKFIAIPVSIWSATFDIGVTTSVGSPHRPSVGLLASLKALGYSYLDIISMIMKRFGGWIIIISTSSLLFLYIYTIKKTISKLEHTLFLLVSVSIIWSLAELVLGIVPGANYIRVLRPGAITAAVLASLSLKNATTSIINGNRKRVIVSIIFVVLLVSSLGIAYGAAYRTPWILSGNDYATSSDIDGWRWMFEYGDESRSPIVTLGTSGRRFADYTIGYQGRKDNSLTNSVIAPPHFRDIEELSENKSYLMTRQRSRQMTMEIGTKRFTKSDFDSIYYNYSRGRIYTSGNLNVSIISDSSR
jgi:hypothetical protein